MRCTNCGQELAADERFCGNCGTPRPATADTLPAAISCPKCGQPLSADDIFCGNCGAPRPAPVEELHVEPVAPRRGPIPGWAWVASGIGGVILIAALVVLNVYRGGRSPTAPPALTQPAPTALAQAPSPTPAPPTAAPTPTETPFPTQVPPVGSSNIYVEYILDDSGSMLETLQGKTKLAIAQSVLSARVPALPPDINVGLRLYGHRVPFQEKEESCADIELVVPVEVGGAQHIISWLPTMQAQGMTPMSESIRRAAEDFTFEGGHRNIIVLISDGIETCDEDPAEVVRFLQELGIDFKIHVIGLGVDEQARAQLKRIADTAGGIYHDANGEKDLAIALDDIHTKVVEPPPTETTTPTATPTATPTPTCPPPATPEPLWVDPVMSPTFALTQTVTVYLGRGRTVTVTSEAGTTVVNEFFDAYTSPAYVTINLLPNTTHHLKVTGLVEYAPGCFYTLSTTGDRNGNPLIIVQQSLTPTVTPTETPTVTPTATPTRRPPTDTPSPTLQPGLVIQGYVRLNVAGGPGLANAKIYRGFASYPGDLVAITDQNGYYETEFVSIPGDETVTVWAELEGYTFTPAQHSWRHYHGYKLTRLDFVADAHTPTAIARPTYTPTSTPARVPGWTAIGGQWTWLEPGLLYGETDSLDGLFLYDGYYEDFTFSAEAQALDREASLAFRMQDSANGYLVIFVPQGAIGANPGLWLAKRVDGAHSFLAHYSASNLPFVEDWVSLSVQASGSRFWIYLNGTLAIDFTDTSAPAFTSGRLGFRIYGDTSAPCHAYFRNIQLP